MTASWIRVLALLAFPLFVALGCGDSDKKIDTGGKCLLNSDCNASLVCTMGTCHEVCHTSADCPTGASCIVTSDKSFVCRLPAGNVRACETIKTAGGNSTAEEVFVLFSQQ